MHLSIRTQTVALVTVCLAVAIAGVSAVQVGQMSDALGEASDSVDAFAAAVATDDHAPPDVAVGSIIDGDHALAGRPYPDVLNEVVGIALAVIVRANIQRAMHADVLQCNA